MGVRERGLELGRVKSSIYRAYTSCWVCSLNKKLKEWYIGITCVWKWGFNLMQYFCVFEELTT